MPKINNGRVSVDGLGRITFATDSPENNMPELNSDYMSDDISRLSQNIDYVEVDEEGSLVDSVNGSVTFNGTLQILSETMNASDSTDVLLLSEAIEITLNTQGSGIPVFLSQNTMSGSDFVFSFASLVAGDNITLDNTTSPGSIIVSSDVSTTYPKLSGNNITTFNPSVFSESGGDLSVIFPPSTYPKLSGTNITQFNPANFSQSGGTLSVTISYPTLNGTNITSFNPATFTQSGGQLSATGSGSGSYATLSGTSITAFNPINFTQSNGTLSVDAVYPTLNGSNITSFNASNFTQSGGVLSVVAGSGGTTLTLSGTTITNAALDPNVFTNTSNLISIQTTPFSSIAGAPSLGPDTEILVVQGETTYSCTLAQLAAEIATINGGGSQSQTYYFELEDGSGCLLLENGSGYIELESGN